MLVLLLAVVRAIDALFLPHTNRWWRGNAARAGRPSAHASSGPEGIVIAPPEEAG
jgi:hypothetical protein